MVDADVVINETEKNGKRYQIILKSWSTILLGD